MVDRRCERMAIQPSGIQLQCEYVDGTGFWTVNIGEPVPAFKWVLCDGHAAILQAMVLEVIREDTQQQADKMGLQPRDKT